MAYSLFLDGVQYPVTPSSIETKINNQNKTITLINEGEVNLLKKAGLTDLTFDLLLPNSKYPFAVYPNGFQPASYYLEQLEKLKVDKKTFQFIVSRLKPSGDLLFDTNLTVSLEDYVIKESAEDGFDIIVPVSLKQFRPFGTKVIEIKKNTAVKSNTTKPVATVKNARPATKEIPKSHKVVKGDTLWAICKKYLGDPTKYPEIAKKNNIKNPNLIYPGQVIKF